MNFATQSWSVKPSKGMIRQNLIFSVGGNRLSHPCFKKAWQDGVHADPDEDPPFCRASDVCQSQQCGLSGSVGGLSHRWMKRGITRNEDDVTPSAGNHPGQNGGGGVGRTLIIHREDIVPILFIHPDHWNILGGSGGINEQIHRTRMKPGSGRHPNPKNQESHDPER